MFYNSDTNDKFLLAVAKVKNEYKNNFMFAAIYGSQNYGLDTPDSDIDIKVAILPSARDVLLKQKRESKLITTENSNNNTILVKDLRDMVNEWYKQNLNFLELLVTPYFYTSDFFKNTHEILYNRNDEIAHYYPKGFYFGQCGLFFKLGAQLKKNFDYSKFVYGLYLVSVLSHYDEDYSFKTCLFTPNYQELRDIKIKKNLEPEKCMAIWHQVEKRMDAYSMKAEQMPNEKNESTRKWLDELLYETIFKFIVLEGH